MEIEKIPEVVTEGEVVVSNVSQVGDSSNNNNHTNLLAAMFNKVKTQVNEDVSKDSSDTVEGVLAEYFGSKLQDNNLSWWSKFYERSKESRVKMALCSLARMYLTAPPTSTETERLFSSAGRIVNKRERLTAENLDKLVFLRDNLKMQNISVVW